MITKLEEHMEYLAQRKAELSGMDKWELINKLIIKELEVREYEKSESARSL